MLLSTAEPLLLCMQILPEERRDIHHHLLDILEPSQDFSAGDFFEAGRAATQAILQVSSAAAHELTDTFDSGNAQPDASLHFVIIPAL